MVSTPDTVQTHKQQVRAYIDAHQDEAVALLQRLMRIRSTNPPGNEAEVADFCADFARRLGFEVEQIEPEPLRRNNIVRLRGTEGRPVMLFNSHLDTPAPGDESKWTYPPLAAEIHDGKIWGVGARSAKAGLAATMMVTKAIVDLGITLRGDILHVQTADELGNGLKGWGPIIERGGVTADYGVFTEANPPLTMEIAARGTIHLGLTVHGVARHSKYKVEEDPRGKAVNAVAKMAKLIVALEEMEFTDWTPHRYVKGPPMLSVNRVHGGHSDIHMADQCTAHVDCRFLPGQDPEHVLRDIRNVIERLQRADPDLKVDLTVERQIPALEVDPGERIVQAMQKAITDVIGREVPLGGVGSTSDMRWMVINLGIPSCKFMFASSVTGTDEHESIEDYMNTIRVYANLVLDELA